MSARTAMRSRPYRNHTMRLVPRRKKARKSPQEIQIHEYAMMKATVDLRFSKYHSLRLQKVRATLGEIYAHARKGEVLVTFNRQHPQICDLESLVLLSSTSLKNQDIAWDEVKKVSRRYMGIRKEVIHPWQRQKRK